MSDSESDGFLEVVSDDDDDFADSDSDDVKKKKRKNNAKEKESKTKKAKTNEKPKPSPKKKVKVETGVATQSRSAGVKPQNLALESAVSAAPTSGQTSMSNNMKGPAASTPLEARNLVREYMLQQNRPYSAIQIHDNLHGRVAKPQLQRALDELSAPGQKCCLRVKDYGKARIYFSDQSLLPGPDASTMRALQDEISTLADTLREKQETEGKLKHDRSRLSSEPSDSLIDSELDKLTAAVEEKTSRLNRLLELSSSSSSAVKTGCGSDLNRDRVVAVESYNFYRNAWKTRREKAFDAADMLCDGGIGRNRKDTMTILGVETDEDEGVVLPKPLALS